MNTIDRNKILVRHLIRTGKVTSQRDLGKKLGYTNESSFSQVVNNKVPFPQKTVENIKTLFPEINTTWLLTGEGEMLTSSDDEKSDNSERRGGNLIPYYDDVSSIGGINEMVAEMSGVSGTTEYIDTGDWFRDATAAIRHYGDSMREYPNGCILALREVKDKTLIVPGRDYVIETEEYRVTKRIQSGKDSEHFKAYSTNTETYPDGHLIHEPFDIPKEAVRRMFLVLGYVVKKNGGTLVFGKK